MKKNHRSSLESQGAKESLVDVLVPAMLEVAHIGISRFLPYMRCSAPLPLMSLAGPSKRTGGTQRSGYLD